MGCKECLGRYGLMISATAFTLGVIISTTTPSWIQTTTDVPVGVATTLDVEYGTLETQYGPFNSQTRTCRTINTITNEVNCTEWVKHEIDNNDCHTFSEDADTQDKLCRQHTTWRALAMLCNLIAIGTAILVALATFTQCLTCGCCGGSFDFIAMMIYWIEVICSIVAWSFAISVVSIIKNTDVVDLLEEEAQNIVEAAQKQDITDITEGDFLWGFGLFIFSGTILGSVCAIFADWASEGSILKCFTDCFACIFCCKK